ncbi:amidase signature enzyme [Testicularia cyperi]|uniref:Glutamyl-tRNA(Gln) amidotransferase subunit A, mitochondrial n=1 Tax=Testicularia cyperi TaxID=1882483 RepID=A0A317XK34_9BASI|nr:amidase signature enzyme [Testicularia cyperi]
MGIARCGAMRCFGIGSSSSAWSFCAVCPGSRQLHTTHTTALAGSRSPSRDPPAATSTTLQDGPLDPYNAFVAEFQQLSPETESADTPLSGWTAAVKANICVAGHPVTCSSRMLHTFEPTFDAAVVELLRSAGAKVTHQTNCDEFGMGSSNLHSYHGVVRNPASPDTPPPNAADDRSWDSSTARVAGGSSGGSAAAVRAGLARLALGSDTGGSVRLPAAYCGVVGLKPSYGLLSRWGLVSYADSLDTVGILTRNVSDVRSAFEILSKHDPRDPTSASPEARTRATEIAHQIGSSFSSTSSSNSEDATSLAGLRIGIPQEYFPKEIHARVMNPFRRAVAAVESLGAEVVPVTLPATRSALSAYYIISCAEASSNLARYDGVEYGFHAPPSTRAGGEHPYAATRTAGFGDEVRKRILLGTFALTADAFDNYFLQASRVRSAVRDDFARVFRIQNALLAGRDAGAVSSSEGVDALLHPSAVNTAPTLKEALDASSAADSLAEYTQDVLTVPASLAGLPAMSVPAGTADDDGWPVGVTAVSQWGCEHVLFRIGAAIESQLET